MDIIHAVNDSHLPRIAAAALRERFAVMPVVVLSGSRQCGKSTLAGVVAPPRARTATFDDMDALELARRDPEALLGGAACVVLDKVQRVPELLLSVKKAVDRDRRPGRFLLTGSANLLLMRQVSESLAGRASYVTLWPMTRRERLGLGTAGAWDALLSARDESWEDVLDAEDAPAADWREEAVRGGYPVPAVHLRRTADRAVWFEGYVRTYLERDLRDLAGIAALPDFARVLRATALRLGQLLNQTELGRDCAVAQPTVHRWLNLLETSYLLMRLPAFAVNRTKRLMKTPKTYWCDTGLALHLAGGEPGGAHLENLVLHDLVVWRDARSERAELSYWRTASGEEVDLVVETGGRLLPIEIKASARPRLADATALRSFRAEYGDKARHGLLLHTGSKIERLAPDVLAVPWWRVI
jgi:predicted AAA+ superfamily ATPase